MAEIKCPMCGKPNPAELDVCQYCEARLKPLTDELSRSQPPIHPGEEPTEQDTDQLEPALPQWLRDIRHQAHDNVDDDESAGQASPEDETPQQNEPADFLAGLQSQPDDEDEIPDWLSGLRGDAGQDAEQGSSTEDDDLAALRSMLGEDTPADRNTEESSAPSWISELSAEDAIGETAQPESQTTSSDADFEWGTTFESDSTPPSDSTEDETPFDTELPAWLQGVDDAETEGSQSPPPMEIPIEDAASGSEEEVSPSYSEGDLPDWLASLGEEEHETTAPEETEQPEAETSVEWPTSVGEESGEGSLPEDLESPVESTADWLASMEEETDEEPEVPGTPQPASDDEIPDWIATLGETDSEEDVQSVPEAQATTESGLPDWLSSFGEEEGAQEEGEELFPASETPETAQQTTEDEIPDWLSSVDSDSGEIDQSVEAVESSYSASNDTVDEREGGLPDPSADDEGEPVSTEEMESIFSMDLPDWLSGDEGLSEGETADVEAEDLDPGELPSWVQAMRPVESVISETEGETLEDQPVEEKGPLAGLRGVLPAVPGVGPSSTPMAYSVKLQASADQQANATILEEMLAAEIHPKSIRTQKVVYTQRILRWVIAALVFFVVAGTVFSGTQINQMPTSAPLETSAALNYVQNTLQPGAPVLLIFDYEAALAGEVEAAAGPLVDHMLTLKAPRLSLISIKPTGSGLAERFIATLQASHNYERNSQFLNLGYLPGGAAGVLAFSESPVSTKPFTTTGANAWETPVLQGVGSLSDFAAIFLLTNDIETARIWIEQTEISRGGAGLLVISSAQSGPMIQPYFQSRQIDGLVTGLDGSAPIEQVNSGRPGLVRRYWDAYGFGLLMASALIAVGSLWSLLSGLQAGRKALGEA